MLVPRPGCHRHEREVGEHLAGAHGHAEAGGGGATPHQGPDERADEGGEDAYREGLRAGGAAEAVRGVAQADDDEGCDEGAQHPGIARALRHPGHEMSVATAL
jgi:hypothetical protein